MVTVEVDMTSTLISDAQFTIDTSFVYLSFLSGVSTHVSLDSVLCSIGRMRATVIVLFVFAVLQRSDFLGNTRPIFRRLSTCSAAVARHGEEGKGGGEVGVGWWW